MLFLLVSGPKIVQLVSRTKTACVQTFEYMGKGMVNPSGFYDRRHKIMSITVRFCKERVYLVVYYKNCTELVSRSNLVRLA